MMILLEHTVYSKLHDNQQYLIDLHSFNNQKNYIYAYVLCTYKMLHLQDGTLTSRNLEADTRLTCQVYGLWEFGILQRF